MEVLRRGDGDLPSGLRAAEFGECGRIARTGAVC